MPSYSTLSSPNDHQPFSILSKFKQTFHLVCMILATQFRPYSESNSFILPISRSFPRPNSISNITRMRFHSVSSSSWRSPTINCLPLYFNSFEIEMQSYQPIRPSASVGKTILSSTLQVLVALASSSSMGQVHNRLHSTEIVKFCMIIGFSFSFSGIFLRSSYPRTARIIENIGTFIAGAGFFIWTSLLLPQNFTWINWLACAFSLLAFFISLV